MFPDQAEAVDQLVRHLHRPGSRALVLADEPATSRYLPEQRVFLRWLAADSESELLAAADTVLADPDIEWDDVGIWEKDGPAVLMDSTTPGAELDEEYPAGGQPDQALAPLPAGRWRVRAVHTTGEFPWVGVVQLLPESPADRGEGQGVVSGRGGCGV
ncbi:Imm21 family immunity protein [Streptomyces sp. NPDC051001]|uniref:Imm21 family immunity protein n=1 Tax=Streptomyces sp. NPDC051001 TaxID=3155795 RepID=UPI0034234566